MQKVITLNNGQLMPTLGLGTWKAEPNKVGDAVKYAILEAGYKHIDGAAIYLNETEIGKVYKEVFQSIKREEIFITSKLWNTNHNPIYVEEALRKTLFELQLDYLDLYLMHWGIAFKHGEELKPIKDGKAELESISIRQTWEAMEKLVAKGLVKSIGVANFNAVMLIDLLTYAKIKPVTNQIEVHPYNNQQKLINFCKEKEIVVTAYSPLGRTGAVSTNDPRLFEDKVIVELAQKYSQPPSHIVLNWAVNRGTIPIPKSTNLERIKENISFYDFEISQDDIMKINSLNKNLRFVDPGNQWGIPYFN